MPHFNPVNSGFTRHRPQQDSNQYTVRSGDTMGKIARQHGVTLQQLLDANPQVRNPNMIHVGQALNLPRDAQA